MLLRFHTYLRHIASRNFPLCRRKPCSTIGKTVKSPFPVPIPLTVGAVVSTERLCLLLIDVAALCFTCFFIFSWSAFSGGDPVMQSELQVEL